MFNDIIVYHVFCNFLSVICCRRSLNWSTKSIIVVALMISHFNNLFFCQACCVCYNLVVNRTSWCTSWVFVCNHIKIEQFVAIVIDDIALYDGTWLRIHSLFILCILEESCEIVFVHQNIQNMWIVTWVKLLDCRFKLFLRF